MEFYFICLINLKFLDRRKRTLLLIVKIYFARGGGTTRPTLDTPRDLEFEEKRSADTNYKYIR
jgi:hypothetical protein